VTMLQMYLNKILIIIIATDIFALGILAVFLFNHRVNIRRKAQAREFSLRMLAALQNSETVSQVAAHMGLEVTDVMQYCQAHGLETPEERKSRLEAIKKRKEDETRKIMEEEQAWRQEQEHIAEERQREKDVTAKIRRERLKKFGII
jgi:galactokinase